MTLFIIFSGAGAGGVLRFLLVNSISKFNSDQLPFGTLAVNISGGLVAGFLVARLSKMENPAIYQQLLVIGLLGGFTTFSAFSVETIALINANKVCEALLYVLSSNVGSILACGIGYYFGKRS